MKYPEDVFSKIYNKEIQYVFAVHKDSSFGVSDLQHLKSTVFDVAKTRGTGRFRIATQRKYCNLEILNFINLASPQIGACFAEKLSVRMNFEQYENEYF